MSLCGIWMSAHTARQHRSDRKGWYIVCIPHGTLALPSQWYDHHLPLPRRHDHVQNPPLDRLHQHTQTKRTAKRTAHQPPTLSEPLHAQPMESAEHYPVGHFGPAHGLTPAQAWEAQQLLNRANRLRPLRGSEAQARFALRMAGIIAVVKQGRVGNSAWGRRMHGKRGGKGMARQGLRHLRAIASLGSRAAASKRQAQKPPHAAQDALAQLGACVGSMSWTGETGVYWPAEL
jgi:hypothetical protein